MESLHKRQSKCLASKANVIGTSTFSGVPTLTPRRIHLACPVFFFCWWHLRVSTLSLDVSQAWCTQRELLFLHFWLVSTYRVFDETRNLLVLRCESVLLIDYTCALLKAKRLVSMINLSLTDPFVIGGPQTLRMLWQGWRSINSTSRAGRQVALLG